MKITLRPIKENEENSVFEMFNDIPATENGFGHKLNGLPITNFEQEIGALVKESKSKNVENDRVPQIYLILFIDDTPVGFSKLRH